MKILISPAKSLNFDKLSENIGHTNIKFKKEAWEIAQVLKKQSPKDLSELMSISDKLAALNWQRNQDYRKNFNPENSKQALFAFDGEVYTGIDALKLSVENIDYLQNNLRILSGQYGLLKPLDKILAYRLEMGTKLSINGSKNLYDYWGNRITDSINSELNEEDVLVNLASIEYFKSVKKKDVKSKIITPIFKDYKNGKLKTISFFAKKARGLMVRYMAENNIVNDVEKLKEFDLGGYRYDSKLSDEKNFTYTR
jgi:cytoplasmic iron level regulating protein YaaA (DUF328/UPF0246 family)